MLAKKCDRCKKFYDIDQARVTRGGDFADFPRADMCLIVREEGCRVITEYDLCPGCLKLLIEFVERPAREGSTT